jgi:cobalt-zinc-cadmium efflux system outer membrane protein
MSKVWRAIICYFVFFTAITLNVGHGQGIIKDTLRLDIHKAENLFLQSNLQIIAQKYNLDAARALIIQAKLYPNADFYWGNNFYNSRTDQYFPLSLSHTNSDNNAQISQLIILGRKIHKQTQIAETNYKLAEDNLYDLLRSLKFALRSSFFTIYYLWQTAKVYDEEINALKTIVSAYDQVEGKGYVSKAEVVQVQAQLYSLQNEYQTLIDNINDQQSQLRLLLQSSPNIYIEPLVDTEIVKADPLVYKLESLLDSAYLNRTDLMIAKDDLLLSRQNYDLQKSLAIPDITLSASFVQSSNYVPDDLNYGIGIPLPLFNRNQGNIKNASVLIQYTNTQLELTQKTLEEQVYRAFQKAIDADKLYKGIDPAFAGNFDRLAKEMLDHYMKRNVSLLNFLTFYDSYKQNIVQLNTILCNKVNALENINFLTGTNLFNK